MITKCALFLTVTLCLLTGGCNSATNKKVIQKQNPNQDVLEVLGTERKIVFNCFYMNRERGIPCLIKYYQVVSDGMLC